MSPSVQVKIHGREYTLRSHESERQISRVVKFVEEKFAETAQGQPVDTRDLTVLTLLNLAGQHLRLLDETENMPTGLEERLQRLAEQVERVLGE